MSATSFKERSLNQLVGTVLHEEVTVISLDRNRGKELIQAAMREWGERNQEYKQSERLRGWRENALARESRDASRISLVLQISRAVAQRGEDSIEVVFSEEENELLLEPVSLTILPDGKYVFTGTHHTSYTWERNYCGGFQTEHTYTDYEVVVCSDGTLSHQKVEERQATT